MNIIIQFILEIHRAPLPRIIEIIPNIMAAVIGGVLLSIGSFTAFKLYKYYRYRDVREFWRPFLENDRTIRFSEYSVDDPDDPDLQIAERAGGQLMTKGMAISIKNITEFLESYSINLFDDENTTLIWGDNDTVLDEDQRIILGSQASNTYAQSALNNIEDFFDVPLEIDSETLELCHELTTFQPEIEDGDGRDFAIIIRSTMENIQTDYLLVAGCLQYGTQAASMAVTDPEFMKRVTREVNNIDNVIFGIESNIENGWPNDYKLLEIDGKEYVRELN